MGVETLLDVVVVGAFVAAAVAVGLRARGTGQPAPRRLMLWLLSVVLVAGVAPLIPSEDVGGLPAAVLLVGLGLYSVLLLRFGAALRAAPEPLERLATVLLFADAATAAVALGFVGGETGLFAIFFAYAGFALLAHVVVQVVLAQQIRELASSFVQRRAIVLSSGLLVLAASIVVGVFAPLEVAGTLALMGAVVAVVLLVAGAAPPRWMMGAFLLPDYDKLMAAEERLTTAPDVRDALEELLAALLRLYAGRAAWLRYEDELLATSGGNPADFGREAPSRRSNDRGPHPITDGAGSTLWLLQAEYASCEVEVVADRDPVLYGLDIANLLPRTARRVTVALEGRRHEERRRAQQQAEQEAAHYRRIADLKDDLLATINHELRTPLQTVTGALELATARWDQVADGQRRMLVERADHNARALSQVVMSVLALVELRTGETRPNPVPVGLDELVDRVVASLPDEGRTEVVVPTSEVVVDPELTARVLHQLMDNALRHTDGAVRVEVDVDDDELRLLVHDTGPGVPDGLLAPFERGGHYLHRTTRGLGLGLSLAVETVDLLGGVLHFTHDGSGSTATCRLPHAATTRTTTATSIRAD